MATWYEEAVFYHMYPIGMTGARGKTQRRELSTGLNSWISGCLILQKLAAQQFI